MARDKSTDKEMTELDKEIEAKVDSLFVESEFSEAGDVSGEDDPWKNIEEYFYTLEWEINPETLDKISHEAKKLQSRYSEGPVAELLGWMEQMIQIVRSQGSDVDQDNMKVFHRIREEMLKIAKDPTQDPEPLVAALRDEVPQFLELQQEAPTITVGMAREEEETLFEELDRAVEDALRVEDEVPEGAEEPTLEEFEAAEEEPALTETTIEEGLAPQEEVVEEALETGLEEISPLEEALEIEEEEPSIVEEPPILEEFEAAEEEPALTETTIEESLAPQEEVVEEALETGLEEISPLEEALEAEEEEPSIAEEPPILEEFEAAEEEPTLVDDTSIEEDFALGEDMMETGEAGPEEVVWESKAQQEAEVAAEPTAKAPTLETGEMPAGEARGVQEVKDSIAEGIEQVQTLLERFRSAEDIFGLAAFREKISTRMQEYSDSLAKAISSLEEGVHSLDGMRLTLERQEEESVPEVTAGVTEDILFVSVSDRVFGIPLGSVQGIFRVPGRYVKQVLKRPEIRLKGRDVALVQLRKTMGLGSALYTLPREDKRIVWVSSGAVEAGLLVDGVIARREVVMEPVADDGSPHLRGRVSIEKAAFVLDVEAL